MSFSDLDKLRERTPAGLEIVRNIIATVEGGMQRGPQLIGRGSLILGDAMPLEISQANWHASPRSLGQPSTPHRTVTVRALGQIMDERSGSGIVYDVVNKGYVAEPIVLPGEDGSVAGSPTCGSVEIAGKTYEGPLLFADAELEKLDPALIARRLERFEAVARIAIGD